MKNMGTIDRIVRIIMAVIIAMLYFAGTIYGAVAIVQLILAGIFILTRLVSTCHLYLPIGIKTYKV